MFKVAGWKPRDQGQVDGFYRRLEPMFKALQALRVAVWKNVTSEDYRIQTIKPGKAFLPKDMVEAYGDEMVKTTSNEERFVLGTTSLGLSKFVVSNGFMTKELKGIMEPEVVVESTFRAALSTEKKPRPARSAHVRSRQDGHG